MESAYIFYFLAWHSVCKCFRLTGSSWSSRFIISLTSCHIGKTADTLNWDRTAHTLTAKLKGKKEEEEPAGDKKSHLPSRGVRCDRVRAQAPADTADDGNSQTEIREKRERRQKRRLMSSRGKNTAGVDSQETTSALSQSSKSATSKHLCNICAFFSLEPCSHFEHLNVSQSNFYWFKELRRRE